MGTNDSSSSGGADAAKAYWNAHRKLNEAWQTVYGDQLPRLSAGAKASFEHAVASVHDQLTMSAVGSADLRRVLDVDSTKDVAKVILTSADMNGVTPDQALSAMRAECERRGTTRIPLPEFLRPVLVTLFTADIAHRPRVGPNRHWPRLLQYLRELERATDWSPDGRGVRLVNAGGRGPVARNPQDPTKLAIVIDAAYL